MINFREMLWCKTEDVVIIKVIRNNLWRFGERKHAYMIKFIYKVLLTINSTILVVSVYMIKAGVVPEGINNIQRLLLYCSYIVGPVIWSLLCLASVKWLSKDTIEGGICEVEEANNSYLPSYLGYFFVALSVNDKTTLVFVFLILFVFSFHSQTVYFNPLFLLWGYKFYYMKMQDGRKIFIVTKREIVTNKSLAFQNLRRINYFTFIDVERYK